MNNNSSRTLWISIGAALFAIFLLYSYSQEHKAEYDKRLGTLKQVVVAKRDIIEMSTIDDTMVETISVPIDFIQPGAIENPEEVIGSVAAAPIKQREQILITKVLRPSPNTGLSLQVAPNKRALTIPVDEVRGVAKLIRPGDRIDIIASTETGTGPNRQVSVRTVMQDVFVLATGVNITNNIPRTVEMNNNNRMNIRNLSGDTTFTTITIELTPEEAQSMVLLQATNPGGIFITLRNPNDRAKRTMPSASLNNLNTTDLSVSRPVNTVPENVVYTPLQNTTARNRNISSVWVDIN